MRRDDGTVAFRLDIPDGWLPFPDNPTLFHSTENNAMIGFIPESHKNVVLEPPMKAAAQLNALEFDMLGALTINLDIRPDLSFQHHHEMHTEQINGIRFKNLTGLDGTVLMDAYFAHVETIGQTIIFDGFLCVFMNKPAYEQHKEVVQQAIDSVQSG